MQTLKLHACLLLLATMRPVYLASMVYQQPQDERTIVAGSAVNRFGAKLLADLASQRPRKNLFVSPLSVFAALTMAENGAAGATRDAMRRALTVPSVLDDNALHESAAALLKSLASETGVELSIANALWSDTQWPLSSGYIEQCRKFYGANATTLDFNQPSAANTINQWVSEKTKGKIQSIVNPAIVSASKGILTNAVYFKGTWEQTFPKDETKDGPFHLVNGRMKNVPLMHLSSIKNAYRSGDGFEAAALTYQGSSTITLYAILPAAGKRPEQVLTKISVDKLRSPAEPNELELRLPKFTLDFEASLKNALERMGMSIAFHAGADFAPMGSPRFYIGEVLHKTRLEVDEEGTVAAATTAITMRATAAIRQTLQKKVLIFDRPFALLLCDTKSGAILFAGVIYDPE